MRRTKPSVTNPFVQVQVPDQATEDTRPEQTAAEREYTICGSLNAPVWRRGRYCQELWMVPLRAA